MWPLNIEMGITGGYIGDEYMGVFRDICLEPVAGLIVGCIGADHEELIFRQASNNYIALQSAAFVQPLDINDLPDGNCDIIGADPVEECFGVFTLDEIFGHQ